MPRRISMKKFIEENKADIDACIKRKAPGQPINNSERRLWILNDESLYNWARSEGVDI